MALGGSASLPIDPKDVAAEGGPKSNKNNKNPPHASYHSPPSAQDLPSARGASECGSYSGILAICTLTHSVPLRSIGGLGVTLDGRLEIGSWCLKRCTGPLDPVLG